MNEDDIVDQHSIHCYECGAEEEYSGPIDVGAEPLCENPDCRHPLVRHEILTSGGLSENGEFELPKFK